MNIKKLLFAIRVNTSVLLVFSLSPLDNDSIVRTFIGDYTYRETNPGVSEYFMNPVVLGSETDSFILLRGNYEDAYRLKKSDEDNAVYSYLRDIKAQVKLPENYGVLMIEMHDYGEIMKLRKSENNLVADLSSRNRRNTILYGTAVNSGINIGAGIGFYTQANGTMPDFTAEVYTRIDDKLSMDIRNSRTVYDEVLAIGYVDSGFEARCFSSVEQTAVSIPVSVNEKLGLEIGCVSRTMSPLDNSGNSGYSLVENGNSQDIRLSVFYDINDNTEFSLYMGESNSNEKSSMRYNDIEFGYLQTVSRQGYVSAAVNKSMEKTVVDAGLRIPGNTLTITGKLESWPFTQGIEDIFSARRYVEIPINTGNNTVYGRIKYKYRDNLDCSVLIEYAQLAPNVSMTSWEPGVLGFGRVNVIENDMQINDTRFITPTLGVKYRFKGQWELDYSITQFIPLAAGGTGAPGGVTPAPEDKKEGGFNNQYFTVKYYL